MSNGVCKHQATWRRGGRGHQSIHYLCRTCERWVQPRLVLEGGNLENETSGKGDPEVNEPVSTNTQIALLR